MIRYPMVIFLLCVWIGAGTFAMTCYTGLLGRKGRVQTAGAYIGLAGFLCGGVAWALSLGHPLRALNILGHISSKVSQEMIFIGVMVLIVLGYLLVEKLGYSQETRKRLVITGLVCALLAGVGSGRMYYMAARTAFATWTLPAMTLAVTVMMGVSVFYLLSSYLDNELSETKKMGLITASSAVFETAVLAVYMGGLCSAKTADPILRFDCLIGGEFAPEFWWGMVAAGLLVPFVLAAVGKWVKNTVYHKAASVVTLVAVIAANAAFAKLLNITVGTLRRIY